MNYLSVFKTTRFGDKLYDVFNFNYIEKRNKFDLRWPLETMILNKIMISPLREMCVLFDEKRL